jgi:protein involved in temperature-dependent protein secretion
MDDYIQILPGTPTIFSGKAKVSNKDFTMIKQAALLVHADGTTEAYTHIAPKEKDGSTKPLVAGRYALGARGYTQGGELRLAPVLTLVPGAPK